jgi:hypothetical protein
MCVHIAPFNHFIILNHIQFLSLRLLNKRTRVRLSPEPLDLQPLPGRGQLFAVANLKGWFVAAIRHAGSDICACVSLLDRSLSDTVYQP